MLHRAGTQEYLNYNTFSKYTITTPIKEHKLKVPLWGFAKFCNNFTKNCRKLALIKQYICISLFMF